MPEESDNPENQGSSGEPGPAGRVGPRAAVDDVDEISLLELVNVLLKRWKLVVSLPVASALVAAVISLILPVKYTATASFVPESESQSVNLPGGLAGLAAQFGVSVPGGGTNSPRFYADVLESRTLRDQVLLTRFADPRAEAATDSAALLDMLEIEGDSEIERLEKGRQLLGQAVSVRVDNETGIVSLSVETRRYRALAASVANRFIDLLSEFNMETRQSNAGLRRRFVEARMSEAENELLAAEEALNLFLERNRGWERFSQLAFEHDRLQRQVTIKQEVFTALRRSYEEARIQEVNNTPVITVIDEAVPPERRSSPRRKLNVILAFVLGGVIGVFGAFGLEFFDRARESDTDEFAKFTSHWSGIKSELRSLGRRTRRHSDD